MVDGRADDDWCATKIHIYIHIYIYVCVLTMINNISGTLLITRNPGITGCHIDFIR